MPFFRHNADLHYFAHVPKCGGSSVEDMLEERFGPLGFLDRSHLQQGAAFRWTRSSPQHVTWDEVRRLVPERWIASSFTVVRHPLARVVSAYHHAAQRKVIPPLLPLERWFDRCAAQMERDISVHDRHLRRQVDFVPEGARVFRLEDGLQPVADWLSEAFGVPGPPPPHVLPGAEKVRDIAALRAPMPVSATFRARVAEYYRPDFERFGYDPDDASTAGLVVHQPRPGARPLAERARLVGNGLLSAFDRAVGRARRPIRGVRRRLHAEP